MSPSAQLVWALVLAGAAPSSLRTHRVRAVRPNPVVTLIGGGLAGLSCALVAASAPI